MASILVVCSGNLCRSPFAAAVLGRMLTERVGPSATEVSSAGTIARAGEPATREAIAVASEHGVDVSSHTARPLTREDLAGADLVLAVSTEHREAVVHLDPQAATKTFTLKELVRLLEDLPDPSEAEEDGSFAARVAEADAHRRMGFKEHRDDEDVADPVGYPLGTYRAVAWELASWSERLVSGLFGVPAGAIPPRAAVEGPSNAAGSPPAP